MSTFNGLIPEIDGISIDRFDGDNLKSKIFFLSHCHEDHMQGLNKNMLEHLKKDSRIFVSPVSNVILKSRSPELSSYFKILNVNETSLVKIPSGSNENDSKDNYISVTLIPAGHCPGSVMFLFEKSDSTRILYTGDFRVNINEFMKLEHFHNNDGTTKIIHKMYFDSTFWDETYKYFPKRTKSCDYICSIIDEWISKGKNHLISLSTPAKYGSEYLYMKISGQLKMPIHVQEKAFKIYSQISEMCNAITQNPAITQIHSCSFGREIKRSIKCRPENEKIKILHIRPSALRWFSLECEDSLFTEDVESNSFNVCYSSHSSYDELCEFLMYLKPKKIEPCVVPEKLAHKFYESLNKFSEKFGCEPCAYSEKNYIFDENKLQNEALPCIAKINFGGLSSDSEDEVERKPNTKSILNWEIKPLETVSNKKIKLFK